MLALAPFAFAYGLVYWGEQYVPSGLAAVLFGIMPLYTALLAGVAAAGRAAARAAPARGADRDRRARARLPRERRARAAEKAALGAAALALAPLGAAVGSISQKRRGAELDAVVLNGWAMLVGGLLLLLVSALGEDWGDFVWSAESVGSIAYLALFGSAIAFVTLTVLLRHISALAISFLAMLLPVRRAGVRRDALRRADHRAGGGRRGAGGDRPPDRPAVAPPDPGAGRPADGAPATAET